MTYTTRVCEPTRVSREIVPYLTWQMSPTSRSLTETCCTWPARRVANLCSCSILLWSPRNWRSLRQSLNAVTNTTTTTAPRIATPSIQPAFDSVSSWPPASRPRTPCQFVIDSDVRQPHPYPHPYSLVLCWSRYLARDHVGRWGRWFFFSSCRLPFVSFILQCRPTNIRPWVIRLDLWPIDANDSWLRPVLHVVSGTYFDFPLLSFWIRNRYWTNTETDRKNVLLWYILQ